MKTQAPTQHEPTQQEKQTRQFSAQSQLTVSEPVFADNSEAAATQRKFAAIAANSTQTVQQKNITQRLAQSSRTLTQRQQQDAINQKPQQREGSSTKTNNTGLPDNLKSGIESLSGMSMDHVKVHYNSAQPAQLNAHAYAQGSDIHIAPGQEQHLPHEAWHVVQQAQGRVKPTLQMKEGVPVNDDAGLEHEADVMGAKAAQLKINIDSPSLISKISTNSTAQRKILINEAHKNEHQVYDHLTTNDVKVKDAFISEIKNKPEKIQNLAEESNAYIDDFGSDVKDKTQIANWNSEGEDYKYTETKKDAEAIAKDTVKYYLYKKFKWLNIGVAAYMTGDVTGLLMATSLQDNVSLEILKGKKDNGETASTWAPPENYSKADDPIYSTSTAKILDVPANELMLHMNEAMNKKRGKTVNTPNFYVKGDTEGSTKLPDTFKHKKLASKLVETDVETDPSLTGTRDAYKKKFDSFTKPTSKPWDKETYEATDMIGKLYPGKKQEIRDVLLPENAEKEMLQKIETYRNRKLSNKNIILMWGRLSGLGGGAHTELDSHPITMVQIAKKISTDLPRRTIVLIGDKVVSASILTKAGVQNEIIDINTFWDDSYFKDNKIPMGDRRYQHYLVQEMSRKNDAVSIGMRSGSLEATALLGVKTIFLDDKGNNAEGRMEFWAGNAANGRSEAIKSKGWQAIETAHEGPVENYKRVATSRKTGDKIHSGEIETILTTLADMKTQFELKNDDNAAVSAPQTQARIKKFTDKIATYGDIKNLSADLALTHKNIINQPNIKTGPSATETVKLLSATYVSIKTKVEDKLKNIGTIGIGLTANELDQISGLAQYMISKISNLESLAPAKMHERWRELSIEERGAAKEEIYNHKEKYPNVLKHIFHHKVSIWRG